MSKLWIASLLFAVRSFASDASSLQIPLRFEPLPDSRDFLAHDNSGIRISAHGVQLGAVQMRFVAARDTTPTGIGLQESRSNYLIGNDPSKWRSNVPNYT